MPAEQERRMVRGAFSIDTMVDDLAVEPRQTAAIRGKSAAVAALAPAIQFVAGFANFSRLRQAKRSRVGLC